MRGNVLVMTFTQLLGNFGRSLAFPYASLFILELGGRPEQIGLINSLTPLLGLVAFPLAGYLADHVGRVKVIAYTSYFAAGIYLLYVTAPNWQVLAVAAFLGGLMVLQFPASSALIADSLRPEDRGRGMATMNSLSGIPALLAPYLAGLLLTLWDVRTGMRLLYGTHMVIMLLHGTLDVRFLRETATATNKAPRLAELPGLIRGAYAGAPALLRGLPREVKALAGVVALGFMGNAVAGPFWVVYAIERLGLNSEQWGLILLIETALRNVLFIPAGFLVDRWGRAPCILVGLILSLITAPLFILASDFASVLLVRALTAASNAIFIPACAALLANAVPRDTRGRVMAAIGQGTVMFGAAAGGTGGPGLGYVITVPLMLSSLAAGYLYAWRPTSPWWFMLGATLIATLLTLAYIRDGQQAQA
jgi:MFS family permease